MTNGKRGNLVAVTVKNRVGAEVKGVDPFARKRLKGALISSQLVASRILTSRPSLGAADSTSDRSVTFSVGAERTCCVAAPRLRIVARCQFRRNTDHNKRRAHFVEVREPVGTQVSGNEPSGRKFVNPADNPK